MLWFFLQPAFGAADEITLKTFVQKQARILVWF